jgi:hypothetical protein
MLIPSRPRRCDRSLQFLVDLPRPLLRLEPLPLDVELTKEERQSGFVPAQPDEFPADPLLSVSGASQMRLTIRNWVRAEGLERPSHNLARRERENTAEESNS